MTGEDKNRWPAATETALDTADSLQYSRQQPPWHVFVLSFFTLCIYDVYWFFKCLNQLHEESQTTKSAISPDNATGVEASSEAAGQAISKTGSNSSESQDRPLHFCFNHPYFSTLISLVPFANLIIAMQFFALVGELLPEKQSFWHKHHMFCAFALSLAVGALVLLYRLPEPYHFAYLLCALPLALVQHGLNQHWQVIEQNKLIVRSAFNPIELVIIFFGAGFIGLCTVGPSIIPSPH